MNKQLNFLSISKFTNKNISMTHIFIYKLIFFGKGGWNFVCEPSNLVTFLGVNFNHFQCKQFLLARQFHLQKCDSCPKVRRLKSVAHSTLQMFYLDERSLSQVCESVDAGVVHCNVWRLRFHHFSLTFLSEPIGSVVDVHEEVVIVLCFKLEIVRKKV